MRNWIRKRQLLRRAIESELDKFVDELINKYLRFFGWSDAWHHVAITIDDSGKVLVFKNGSLYRFLKDDSFIKWIGDNIKQKNPLTVEFWWRRK
jgi:hypothetical protein